MVMLPFSKILSDALRARQTQYLQHADAQAAATGERTPEPLLYAECLSYVLAEVLLNIRMAMRALQMDGAYEEIVTRAQALADEKWTTRNTMQGAAKPGGEPS